MERISPQATTIDHQPPTERPPIAQAADEDLLVRYQGGDHEAFEELFRRYRQRIFRFILRFLRDETASQDAMQDLFLRIIRDPNRFQARSRFSTWLHTVARNLCIDWLRKQRYRNVVSLDQPREAYSRNSTRTHPPLVEETACTSPDPQERAERSSVRLKLLVAIRALSPDQRVVFLLRELSGLPFIEIARTLHIPLNTAKSRMRYALTNLRETLERLELD